MRDCGCVRGHDRDGSGGMRGRITVRYELTRPGGGMTLGNRTTTGEAFKESPLPDGCFRTVNPAHIDAYHAAIARELG